MTQAEKNAKIERVAKDWQSAYAKAHERTAPPVTWEKGWFTIGNERYPKYRHAQIEQMTKTLRKGFTD